MKISIIVPVYNTEKYLEKCIDSILNQTFKDFELILINDGSTDSSGKICDEYAKKDDRIVVIHKENGGVSKARNTALGIIKGEYVGFVDSDDTIEPTMYETLYNNLTHSKAQISVCDFKQVTSNGVKTNDTDFKIKTYDSSEAIEIIFKGNPFAGHLCNKLFKTELFHDIRLDEDIYIYEDMLAVLKILFHPIKIVYCTESLYNYYLHETSAFHSKLTERYIKSAHTACSRMRDIALKLGSKKIEAIANSKSINSDIHMLSKIASDCEAQKKYSKMIILHLKKYLNIKSFFNLSLRSKIKIMLILVCPKAFFKSIVKNEDRRRI